MFPVKVLLPILVTISLDCKIDTIYIIVYSVYTEPFIKVKL